MRRADVLRGGRILAAGLISLAGLLVVLLAGGGSDSADARERRVGLFKTKCTLSHHGPHDPIVFSGKPGRSHLHDFFGNRSTDAFSTVASLKAAGTTCGRKTDRSAYWTPTLYYDGEPVDPVIVQAYYRVADRDPDTIEPFPSGLRMIAGQATAREKQDSTVISWGCAGAAPLVRANPDENGDQAVVLRDAINRYQSRSPKGRKARAKLRRGLRELREAQELYVAAGETSIPVCPLNTTLELAVRFPECWNGRDLDASDHMSHMAYSVSDRQTGYKSCPRSHPVAVPKLGLQVRYPVVGGPQVMLSAGDAFAGHADFMNGWNQDAQAKLVRTCLNGDVYCSTGDQGPPRQR
jgi:hypothetical protein